MMTVVSRRLICKFLLDFVYPNRCPVCGSLHHPNLAIKSTSVLTKEELDNLKEKEDCAKSAARISV